MSFDQRLGLNEWALNKQQEVIHCPYQPGELKISKGACPKRFQFSWNIRRERKGIGESSDRRGFSLCRKCPIGMEWVREKTIARYAGAGKQGIP